MVKHKYLYTLKYKKVLKYKIGESNLTVENLVSNNFNQVTLVNIIIGAHWNHEPPDRMRLYGHSIISVIFLSKMQNMEFVMSKYWMEQNWGEFYKITDL